VLLGRTFVSSIHTKTRIPSGIWSLLLSQHSASSQHMVKSLTLNPYMSICNLKLCIHIWSTKFVPPPRKCEPKFIKIFRGCYSTKPLSVKKCLRYPQSKICAPRKCGPKFTKNFWSLPFHKIGGHDNVPRDIGKRGPD